MPLLSENFKQIRYILLNLEPSKKIMEWIVSWLDSWAQSSSLRNAIKFVIRQITGKGELQRICEDEPANPKAMKKFENSLYHTKYSEIRRICVSDDMKVKSAFEIIVRTKRIIPDDNPVVMNKMPIFLSKILSYNKLLTKCDEIRSVPFNEENEEHEKMLMSVWNLLKPDEELENRYTKQWGEIGFQGKNPATDFRGMGILSLKNLLYFLESKPAEATKLYSLSLHPRFGYPFAVAGINITSLAFELLRSGKLKAYLYSTDTMKYSLNDFQDLFVRMFCAFSDYYMSSEPENIMEFNQLLGKYKEIITARLEQGNIELLKNGTFLQV